MSRNSEPDPVEWVRTRWDAQALPESKRFAAVASVMRTHQVVTAALDGALRQFELSRTMYLVLVTLALSTRGARPLSYLSRYLMVHPTTVTQLVDELEQRELVRRLPHPTDRRTTLAEILPAGRRLLKRATAGAAAAGFGMSGVDDETLGTVTESLRQVRRAVGDLPDDGDD
jgi:DNA-binding MarR family transcriptional regulator